MRESEFMFQRLGSSTDGSDLKIIKLPAKTEFVSNYQSISDWENDGNSDLMKRTMSLRDLEEPPPDVQAKETIKMLKKSDIVKLDFIFQ